MDVVVNGIVLQADGIEYDILEEAVEKTALSPGMICEIGTRMGGSIGIVIKKIIELSLVGKKIVCVDPWGDIDYHDFERVWHLDYTNTMKRETMARLYAAVRNVPLDLNIFVMEDWEFMERFKDGVPFYNKAKTLENQYSLVFIDGPHCLRNVEEETEFFVPRMVSGGYIIYDNVDHYAHIEIEKYLFSNGVKFLSSSAGESRKAYIKE